MQHLYYNLSRFLCILGILSLSAFDGATAYAQPAETDIRVELRLALWGLYPPTGDYNIETETSVPTERPEFPIEIKIWHPDNAQVSGLLPLSISQPLTYRGPKEILFFRKTTVTADGIIQPIVLARYTVPEGATSLLLLLKPSQPYATNQYQVFGIPFDEGSFPDNSIQAYNLSGEPLYIGVGDEKAEIESRGRHIFELDEQSGHQPRFLVAKRVGEKFRMIRSTRLRLQNKSRQVIVFTTEPNGLIDSAVFK